MSWLSLCLFGIFGGTFVWLQLIQIIFGSFFWLSVTLVLFLVAAFAALFEFGRRSLEKYNKIFGIWLLIVFLIIPLIGWRFGGLAGIDHFSRYSLGFFGSMLTAIAFWLYSNQKSVEKILLRMIAITFLVYSFSLWVILAEFFLQKTGFPIQFFRFILCDIIFLCVWFQYQTFIRQEETKQMPLKKISHQWKQISLFLFILLVPIVVGYIFITLLGYQAKKEIYLESKATIDLVSGNLQDTIRVAKDMTVTLSIFPDVVKALENEDVNGDAENAVLDQYQKVNGDSVCYVMNKEGLVIASSNRHASDSFLGKSYAFRPYFLQAMKGDAGSYFALGVTSKRPGYYASYPVKNEQNQIIGAVVIKINLDNIEEIFARYQYMFLVSPEGVVFLEGVPFLKGKSLIPLSDSVTHSIQKSQQFGSSTFDALFDTWPEDSSRVTVENRPFFLRSTKINGSGWMLMYLQPTERVEYYRLFGITSILLFYILFITFIVITQMIRRNTISSYFASVVLGSQDAIIGKDLRGKIVTWNDGAEKIYGYTKDEMFGKTIDVLLPKDQQEKNRMVLDVIRHGKAVENFEMKHLNKKGEVFDVSVSISPIKDASGVSIGVSTVARDISRMKRLEKMKTEFVSIASHQLRTPLTGIKWFSELLLDEKAGRLTKYQKSYLKEISDSNKRMISLVNDLLEVSHIDDKEKYPLSMTQGDFAEFIQKAVSQQAVIAKMKKVTIQLDPSCSKKLLLTLDWVKMDQVIQNILNNAIKFSPEKGTIEIVCKRPNGQIVCGVTDHGLGIPAAQQSRIFEKFFRADNAVNAGTGTGLGLYIAKSILEVHHGKIWFESKENHGTTFYFSLPIK